MKFNEQDLKFIQKINELIYTDVEGSCSVSSYLLGKYLSNTYPDYDVQVVESYVDVIDDSCDYDELNSTPHVWLEVNNGDNSYIIDLTAEQFFNNNEVYEMKYIGTEIDSDSIHFNPYAKHPDIIGFKENDTNVYFSTTNQVYRAYDGEQDFSAYYQRFSIEGYHEIQMKSAFKESILNDFSVSQDKQILKTNLIENADIVFNNNEVNLEHLDEFIDLYICNPSDFKNFLKLNSSQQSHKLK